MENQVTAPVNTQPAHKYYDAESPFVQYFDRLASIGFTDEQIAGILPSLEKYYRDIVYVEATIPHTGLHSSSLTYLFSGWVQANQNRQLNELLNNHYYETRLDTARPIRAKLSDAAKYEAPAKISDLESA